MLVINPFGRSNARELKKDPYFADIDWEDLELGKYRRALTVHCFISTKSLIILMVSRISSLVPQR